MGDSNSQANSPPIPERTLPVSTASISVDALLDPMHHLATDETAPSSTSSVVAHKDGDQSDEDDFYLRSGLTSLLRKRGKTLPAFFIERGGAVGEETAQSTTRHAIMQSLPFMSSLDFEEFLTTLRKARSESSKRREAAIGPEGPGKESDALPLRSEEPMLFKWAEIDLSSLSDSEQELRINWAKLRGEHGTSLLDRAKNSTGLALLNEAVEVLSDAATKAAACSPEDFHLMPSLPLSIALGRALSLRFDRYGLLDDLHRAISLSQLSIDLAKDLAPEGDYSEQSMLDFQSVLLMKRYKCIGNLKDVDQAILLGCRTVELTPDNDPAKSTRLRSLGDALETRFSHTGELGHLEHAIAFLRRAVELASDNHPDKSTTLHNLGHALELRFSSLGELEDLQQAIVVQHHAIELTSDDHPGKPTMLNSLGISLQSRFDRLGKLEDLEQATVLKRRAVELTPENHPNKPTFLGILSSTLRTRFDRLGDLKDLDQAVAVSHRAVELAPDNHSGKPSLLNNLGISLQTRFNRFGELEDLKQAIEVQRRAIELTPDDHSSKSSRLSNLGSALQIRFSRLGELEDLEKAIATMRRADELTPDKHPNKPIVLLNLGVTLQMRFDHHGKLEDLDQAIIVKRRAVEFTPENHPSKPSTFGNLGNTLQKRFDHLGDLESLEQAIAAKDRAVDLIPDNHRDKSAALSDLGSSLQSRFDSLGELKDLDRAIGVKHRAVNLIPDDHSNKPGLLNNLGNALEMRFIRLGELEDLEQAIAVKHHAIKLIPNDHPNKPTMLINLGSVLLARFDRLGELEDLDHAILVERRAVELTPDKNPDKSTRLSNLGSALQARFDRLADLEDLERAIVVHRRAVELTSDDHPNKLAMLNHLGNTLRARFDCLGEPEDLEEAIVLRRRVVELTPDDHPDKPNWLNNLGHALLSRFECRHEKLDWEYLEQAYKSFLQSDALTPRDHPYKTGSLVILAELDFLRSLAYGEQVSWRNVHERLITAITSEPGPPSLRLYATRMLVNLQAYRFHDVFSTKQAPGKAPSHLFNEVVGVYKHALTLIPELAWLGSSVARRFEVLSDVGALTSEAASIAIAANELHFAIEWLEQGRSVVWGQLLQLRNPMDELQEQHPELALRLRTASRELEKSAYTAQKIRDERKHGSDLSGEDWSKVGSMQDDVAIRGQLAREYKTLLSQIRELTGFESFLMPKKFADIARAWDSSPVILINIGIERYSSALVCLSPEHIIPVPLPDIRQQAIATMALKFNSLLRARSRERTDSREVELDPERFPWVDEGLAKQRASQSAVKNIDSLKKILRFLWQKIVWPVLQAIEKELPTNEDGVLPHVTWCITGSLTSLPIHAAGDYDTPGGKKIFDCVVSSYAPTLSSLLHQPARVGTDLSHSPQILIVSQPATPGCSPLPGTAKEVARVKNHFRPTEIVHLDDTEATVGAVLHAIEEHKCPYIHFACHGMQDPIDPMKSAFALYDGRLDLAKLMFKTSNNATLAFLSACQTATGDATLTEEAVHLAAGMLAMGYKGVIGTLWSIVDEDAPLVTDVFYRELKEREVKASESGGAGGSRAHAAYALHDATKALREKVGESNILQWAPFVHFGR